MNRHELPDNLEVLINPEGEGQVFLHCTEHNYWGQPQPPLVSGCQACWMAHYIVFYGKHRPQEGLLDAAMKVTRDAVQDIERKGEFDFTFFKHPLVRKVGNDGK